MHDLGGIWMVGVELEVSGVNQKGMLSRVLLNCC